MNLSPVDQALQLLTWLLSVAEFIMALYVLSLNAWHIANRHMSAMFLVFAIDNLAVSLMIGATDTSQAALPSYLLAIVSPAMTVGLLLVTIALLKPHWLPGSEPAGKRGRWRWIWWPVYGLVLLPALLTLVDVGLGTRLWYTILNAETYAGGYAPLSEYTAGSLSRPIWVLYFQVASVVSFIPLLYITLLDKEAPPLTRRLAWLLLGAQIAGFIVQMGLRSLLEPTVRTIAVAMIYVFTYAYVSFQQMVSERRLQRGRLQARLAVLVLVITIPILVGVVAYVSARAGALIEQVAIQRQETELLNALRQFQQMSWMVMAVGAVMLSVLAWLTIRQAFRPINMLTETAAAIAAGDLARVAPVESEDEIGALARAFNGMTAQLRNLISGLEQRVAERTAEVERRANQIAAGAEISRATSQVLDPEELLRRAASLIRERFDLYYVGVFVIDETGRKAVLRAGTGEADRIMLERGHTLEVGGSSMVGWACANRRARIALDVGDEAVRFANPLLPETRSEMALPLRLGERALGALDIQSVRPQAFDENDITALQGMADQIAVAMENARLFQKAQTSLQEVERVNRLLTLEGWETLLRATPTAFAESHRPGLAPLTREELGELSIEGTRPPAQPDGQTPALRGAAGPQGADARLRIPLELRGQTIGELIVERAADQPAWSASDLDLLKALAAQAAQTMDSARLFEESQHLAARERVIGQVSAQMRETLDMDTVLQTAARSISEALGLAALDLRLGSEIELNGNYPA